MQIIVNCFTPYRDGVVMLCKPRRGWWYLPGGKVDTDETWIDAVRREVAEEVNLQVFDVTLRGIHLLHIQPEREGVQGTRRLIAQFSAGRAEGAVAKECKEGVIEVVEPGSWNQLPMNDGDRHMIDRTWKSICEQDPTVYFGHFYYDANHHLLDWRMEPQPAN